MDNVVSLPVRKRQIVLQLAVDDRLVMCQLDNKIEIDRDLKAIEFALDRLEDAAHTLKHLLMSMNGDSGQTPANDRV